MSARIRIPAWVPPAAVAAAPWTSSPEAAVTRWFDEILRHRMQGLPFLNTALEVRAIDFARVRGDWLGGLVSPWCVQLMLLPGGGTLWADASPGTRTAVELPVGSLPFIADAGDETLPAFQYFPLLNTASVLADMRSAEWVVRDALRTALTVPAAAEPPAPAPAPAVDPGRRRFLRLGCGA
jgi:[NiFe] hydrogenase assembly HybE family chaperone